MNHLFYADDLCLLAPSAACLQKLVDQYMCSEYRFCNDIIFNTLKSERIVFKPKRYM